MRSSSGQIFLLALLFIVILGVSAADSLSYVVFDRHRLTAEEAEAQAFAAADGAMEELFARLQPADFRAPPPPPPTSFPFLAGTSATATASLQPGVPAPDELTLQTTGEDQGFTRSVQAVVAFPAAHLFAHALFTQSSLVLGPAQIQGGVASDGAIRLSRRTRVQGPILPHAGYAFPDLPADYWTRLVPAYADLIVPGSTRTSALAGRLHPGEVVLIEGNLTVNRPVRLPVAFFVTGRVTIHAPLGTPTALAAVFAQGSRGGRGPAIAATVRQPVYALLFTPGVLRLTGPSYIAGVLLSGTLIAQGQIRIVYRLSFSLPSALFPGGGLRLIAWTSSPPA